MSTTDELAYSLDERSVSFVVDEELYPRDAVYGAAYLFVDRCYVLLTRPADAKVGVRLKAKQATTEAALEALAGEFANELLNQVVRLRVGEATGRIREYTIARAFFADERNADIDRLLAELDAEELADEPLEVEVPWDKKNPEPTNG